MVQLDSVQRVFVVKTYFETHSFDEVIRLFRERFPGHNPPARMTIWGKVNKYTDHATNLNRNKGNSGGLYCSHARYDWCCPSCDSEQPQGCTCRITGLGLTKSTFNRIVAKDRKWHPYKIHKRLQLKDGDFERRMGFCEWLLIQNWDPSFLHDLIIGDEAGFPMNGKVNTQNMRQYAPRGQAPEFTYQDGERRGKRTVWIGLCGDGSLIGPFFFESNVPVV